MEPLTRQEVGLSRFLSRVLRHRPEDAGITLDAHGWADIDALLRGCSMTRAQLERIVACNSKQRFAISRDGRRIRARQGHSIPVELDLEPEQPPEILWHGTAQGSVPSILREGICRMNRQYVHLSAGEETAAAVGRRHGKPAVLTVRAGDMARDGIPFLCSENGVWLVEHVAPAYLGPIHTDWST